MKIGDSERHGKAAASYKTQKIIGSLVLLGSVALIIVVLAWKWSNINYYHEDYVPGEQYAPDLDKTNQSIQDGILTASSTSRYQCPVKTPINYSKPAVNVRDLGEKYLHNYWFFNLNTSSSDSIINIPVWATETIQGVTTTGVSSFLYRGYENNYTGAETSIVLSELNIPDGTPLIAPFPYIFMNNNTESNQDPNLIGDVIIKSSDNKVKIEFKNVYWFCEGQPGTGNQKHMSLIGNSSASTVKVGNARDLIAYSSDSTEIKLYKWSNDHWVALSVKEWLFE